MIPRPFLVLFLLLLSAPVPGRSLNVVIKNQNANYPDSQVYFTFKDAPVSGTIDGQPLVRDQAYSLADIGGGISLQSFAGGRVYFSLGAPLTGTGDPEPINSSVPNWGTRFDKMEMTYSQSDHSGVANLTAIDFFAIPLAIKTYGGNTATGTPLATLTYQPSGDTVASHLAALTDNNPKVLLHDAQGNFLRVLGPTLSPAGAYPSFQPYLSAVRAAGQATRITGLYSHHPDSVATTTQNYDFTATFDGDGNLRLAGGGSSYAGQPSVGPGHVIVIQAGDLALGVYSANPPYTVDGAAAHIGDNDVYSAVVRDILTGYALGFVNSATVDPNTGVAFKDEASEHWWLSPRAFDFLQGNAAYYDDYAAYLQTVSDAYGHPFSDRWQIVQASVNPSSVGTMEIDVLPDVSNQPVITSADTDKAAEGQAYSYQITATNHPTRYGVLGLPPGLKVDAKTGVISGTPTTSGVKHLTLKAVNTNGAGTGPLTLTIAGKPPVITSAASTSGTVGKAFSYQIVATNHPTRYGVLGLTPGIRVNGATGLISGTPTGAGTHKLTLKAVNNTGTGEKKLTLTVGQ